MSTSCVKVVILFEICRYNKYDIGKIRHRGEHRMKSRCKTSFLPLGSWNIDGHAPVLLCLDKREYILAQNKLLSEWRQEACG